jgi:hypothetical protein
MNNRGPVSTMQRAGRARTGKRTRLNPEIELGEEEREIEDKEDSSADIDIPSTRPSIRAIQRRQ